ncbi:aminoglycoside 6-adenylyltransferase [Planococcus lenghuensis]|uniref:Aminoglycoside adenylyltransferase n=1 Tax=Planococcus lenghuensis TaxID=2213202 RepID=A0A1Q2KZA9_9BACL|nr:aminoglycoside 6-adenylyltransferase [Planococcus lenghuensis]AQQ53464.1 aminoglycoside adenylyltransferase [Planococcus lenghuensis]
MRNEQEMMDLILHTAIADERIRAVWMNGSRADANAPRDRMQDYDIVYAVTDIESFRQNPAWIDRFGSRTMMQEPDQLDHARGWKTDMERSYMYLMLFDDGNRLDLRLLAVSAAPAEALADSLTVPLLDKDGLLPGIPPSSDKDYWEQRPTAPQFDAACNEFWWCLQNVAKGIWRDELPYAKKIFEEIVRAPLDDMTAWYIGMESGFQRSAGKMGKYFKKYLPADCWMLYEQTYADSQGDNMWQALFTACELFRLLATEVAKKFGFSYPHEADQNMTKFLQSIRQLPREAKEML